MPLYLTFTTAKVKIKLLSHFFPNSHGCNINLHNINLDDNFDEDAPDIIILIKLLVWHI